MFTAKNLFSMARARLFSGVILCAAISLFAVGLVSPAKADVVKAAPEGFSLSVSAMIDGDPKTVYTALVSDVGKWWHPAHTFSADAENLSIDARAGGCFCEQLANGGSVQHMTIVFAAPGKMLRMQGGLGPLQSLAVAGSMSWQLQETEGVTKLEVKYNVGGYLADGLDAWAKPVESVLDEQLQRLKFYVETGRPESEESAGESTEEGKEDTREETKEVAKQGSAEDAIENTNEDAREDESGQEETDQEETGQEASGEEDTSQEEFDQEVSDPEVAGRDNSDLA